MISPIAFYNSLVYKYLGGCIGVTHKIGQSKWYRWRTTADQLFIPTTPVSTPYPSTTGPTHSTGSTLAHLPSKVWDWTETLPPTVFRSTRSYSSPLLCKSTMGRCITQKETGSLRQTPMEGLKEDSSIVQRRPGPPELKLFIPRDSHHVGCLHISPEGTKTSDCPNPHRNRFHTLS